MQKFAILTVTVTATAAIRKHHFVGFSGAEITTAGGNPYGVAVTDAAIGEAVAVDVIGIVPVEAGAAISKGGQVTVNNVGKAIGDSGSDTLEIVGTALEAAAAAGDIVQILLK